MAKSSVLAAPMAADAPAPSLPMVRLEVRAGSARPTVYEVGDGGFLVGSVPGCDLRLPGPNLPPVLCLIARHAGGASLRKLAPVHAIAVNGQVITSTLLNDGDKIALGTVEITAQIGPVVAEVPAPELEGKTRQLELRELRQRQETTQIEAREDHLKHQVEQLQAEQRAWGSRRAEIEAECRRQMQAVDEAAARLRGQEKDLAAARVSLEAREQAWKAGQEELQRLRDQLAASGAETTKQAEQVLGWRTDLAHLKSQLQDRYRQRRDKLAKMKQGLRRAGVALQKRKRENDAEAVHLGSLRQEQARRQVELESEREQFERTKRVLEEQHQAIATRHTDIQREMTERLDDVESRERKLSDERAALVKGQQQHQLDLVRLDRLQATLDERQKQLQQRALEVDTRFEQLQRDTRELEDQAHELDAWRERLTQENEDFLLRKNEHVEAAGKIDQRAAALESQQAMLTTLRTRMERMREELRQQEQSLSEQRAAQEQAENEFHQQAEEARHLRTHLQNDKELFEQERQRFEERRAMLDQAVAQLRHAQEAQTQAEAALQQRRQEIEAAVAEQTEQSNVLLARGQQLEEQHARAAVDRQSLRDRETALAKTETTIAALQEQLRRRGEALAERERALTEKENRLDEQIARNAALSHSLEEQKKTHADSLEAERLQLTTHAAQLEQLASDVGQREEALATERKKLDEEFDGLQSHRKSLQAERLAFEVDKDKASETAERHRTEFTAAHTEAAQLKAQMIDLETRSEAALERLLRGREQLREHLAELHGYARQGREDLESARKQLQDDAERVRRNEQELHAARDEHRLAVAAFRQQLVEWQGHLEEMRQTILRGESRLDRRKAEVEQQAQQVAAVREELAQQVEQLQEAERAVEVQRGEVQRHLNDMREWYRKKMRELSGIDTAGGAIEGEPTITSPALLDNGERGILSMTGEVDAGDRQLGDLLRSLELIDADTLTALLREARRQRRSLRQLLLAGDYLTLYQMALIEAGNLDGLVLGPVRVIDRLKSTPREALYRVFDPRRNHEALLRHLGEEEMQDAVRPDEYRQRFTAAAAIRHDHIAATYEVLDLAGRPAVLQEWLAGLASGDWPTLAAAPGVWYRLLTQAALALQTCHTAGLVHGRLTPQSFVLTGEGMLKLTGLSEPHWLAAAPGSDDEEPSVAHDLGRVGRIAAGWAGGTPACKSARSKPLPDPLETILRRLQSEAPSDAFADAAALLEALDEAGAGVPANATAWERFLSQVREQTEKVARRRTA